MEFLSLVVSNRFMCEFIYFTSLSISSSTVFVHVPVVGKPYGLQQLVSTLSAIVLALLGQLKAQRQQMSCPLSRQLDTQQASNNSMPKSLEADGQEAMLSK